MKRKLRFFASICICAILLALMSACVGCSADNEADNSLELDASVTHDGLVVKYPSAWEVKDSEEQIEGVPKYTWIYPPCGGAVTIYSQTSDGVELTSASSESAIDNFIDNIIRNIEEGGSMTVLNNPEVSSVDDAIIAKASIEYSSQDTLYVGYLSLWILDNYCGSITACVPNNASAAFHRTMLDIVEEGSLVDSHSSIQIAESSADETSSESDEDSEPQPTQSQINAVNQAESYLLTSAFSKKGLIKQLEYEKFSHKDAKYAANHCSADWNEQARKQANSYLKSGSFSKSGLLKQLEFEEFTTKQAKYGVANCDANWIKEAKEAAKSYTRHSSYSRDGLIDQLEFEGFTHKQAVAGVESVGL